MPINSSWEDEIHRRLLDRAPLASTELCQCILEPLNNEMRKKAFGPAKSDPDIPATAAIDALIDYITHPDKFDPNRGKSLFNYLVMAAHRDMLNKIKSIERKTGKDIHPDSVEDAEYEWNRVLENKSAPDVLDTELLKESAEEWQSWIDCIIHDPIDRKVISMMVDGERRTEAFAETLGLNSLPLPEQRRRVKQVKDRLLKRLQRARERK